MLGIGATAGVGANRAKARKVRAKLRASYDSRTDSDALGATHLTDLADIFLRFFPGGNETRVSQALPFSCVASGPQRRSPLRYRGIPGRRAIQTQGHQTSRRNGARTLTDKKCAAFPSNGLSARAHSRPNVFAFKGEIILYMNGMRFRMRVPSLTRRAVRKGMSLMNYHRTLSYPFEEELMRNKTTVSYLPSNPHIYIPPF